MYMCVSGKKTVLLHKQREPGRTERKSTSNALRTVLLFQGGGALGAYQAGVFEALYRSGLAPDWAVGTSIGAINAALIA